MIDAIRFTRGAIAKKDFVAELTAMPNVRNVRTALALDRVKDEPIVPFG